MSERGFDRAVFDGADVWDGSLPVAIEGGGLVVSCRFFRADRGNHLLADVTDALGVTAGEVNVNLDDAIPMTLSGTVQPGVLEGWDYLAPVLTIARPGKEPETHQVGLFLVMPAQERYTDLSGETQLDGRDMLWFLANARLDKPKGYAAGTNLRDILVEQLEKAGLTRYIVPRTSQTLPRRKRFKRGDSRQEIANYVTKLAGWYPVWADRAGRIRTKRWQPMRDVEAARVLRSQDGVIRGTVTVDPDLTRLTNHVTVIGNNPKTDAVITSVQINNDPRSPTSTVRIGSATPEQPIVLPVWIDDPDIETQDAADQLAKRTLERGSSVMVRLEVTTAPIADWQMHDVTELAITNAAGEEIAEGRWRWAGLRMGLGWDAETTWRFEKLLPWSQVA